MSKILSDLVLENPREITPDAISSRILPLQINTPKSWVSLAVSDMEALLNDHMQLERKAASNALALAYRWPEQIKDDQQKVSRWLEVLVDVARDEVAHMELVREIILERGFNFSKFHTSTYASDLRELCTRGTDPYDLVDRLLVSALIEARSCERFFLLAKYVADERLAKVYHGLWSSEHGHYKVFLEIAYFVLEKEEVDKRFAYFLEEEARIVQNQKDALLHAWPMVS